MIERYSLTLDPAGVVVGRGASNASQTGAIEVTREIFDATAGRVGACRYTDGALESYAPPAPSAPPPTVTGNQWFFALGDLGLAALWRKAVAASKDKDQNRVNLIARDTPLLADDPLLARVCALAGSSADGTPAIDPALVFGRARTEPI